MHIQFLTPPLDGPATGGTLYNRQLLAALAQLPEVQRRELSFEQRSLETRGGRVDQLWVDSLYLAELPGLREQSGAETRVGLLLHYLPSLLAAPLLRTAAELSEREQRALQAADVILTPSEYLRQLVTQICPGKRCVCVTPGVEVTRPGGAAVRDGTALMICNVSENKGVLPFLHELAGSQQPSATFALAIAGDLQLEADYARDCVALRDQHKWLREHVSFLGSVSQRDVFARLAHASVLVSASRMESYGMALAEARALGTPILALPGGNIAHHVAAVSGGELAPDLRQLARALCKLMSEPAELAARLARARASATMRPWSAAAADFLALAIEPGER